MAAIAASQGRGIRGVAAEERLDPWEVECVVHRQTTHPGQAADVDRKPHGAVGRRDRCECTRNGPLANGLAGVSRMGRGVLDRGAGHATIPSPPEESPLTIDGSAPGSTPAAFGPFRVLHQVGAGTTGLVFRAHDPVEGRLVAIKAFRLDLTPERAAELARALQELSERGLSHPSIAAPIGAGVEDGVAWFAQAYVPAESLDSALRQYGPPPVADALAIVTHLAGALDFAAAAGVVHGSLHPRDVLVAPGETHLVDIGVAGALESCGVRAPVRRPYSAPEAAAGRPISRAGDIFALGAIAFELLSGYPVTGAGDDVVAALPDVPGANREALLETLSFALALAPDERYPTALAFAAPLKKALGDALTRPPAARKRRTTQAARDDAPDCRARAGTVVGALDERAADRTGHVRLGCGNRVSSSVWPRDPSLSDRRGARTD